jgi:inosine/xanthosine triphosphate pyrophosphatase family protein
VKIWLEGATRIVRCEKAKAGFGFDPNFVKKAATI